MQRHRAIMIAFFATGLFLSQVSFAESTAADKALADSLFNEGRALLKAGKFEEACPKFEASQKADPSIGTALNLGDCYEQTGRSASAYGAFGEAARLSRERKDVPRQQVAEERQARLDAVLSRLFVRPPSPSVEDLVVRLDDKVLDKGVLGSAIPLDPGKHVLLATASLGSFREELEIPRGPSVTEKQIDFAKPKVAAQQDKPVASAALSGPPSAYQAQMHGPGLTPVKVGVVLLAAGVVGLGSGVALGIAALSHQEDVDGHCDLVAKNACDSVGYNARQQVGAYAAGSTWSFVAGGVFVAGGTALVVAGLVKHKRKAVQAQVVPVISPGFAGFSWKTEF